MAADRARRESVAATADAAIGWLLDLMAAAPGTEIHYVLGNHDHMPVLMDRLEVLADSVPRFHWHPFHVRLGNALFLHGDAGQPGMTPERMVVYREKFAIERPVSELQQRVYGAVVPLRLHVLGARLIFPSPRGRSAGCRARGGAWVRVERECAQRVLRSYPPCAGRCGARWSAVSQRRVAGVGSLGMSAGRSAVEAMTISCLVSCVLCLGVKPEAVPRVRRTPRAIARARRARAARREARPRGLSGEEARAAARPSGEDACAASAQRHNRYFPVRGNAINTAVSAIGRFGIQCLGSSRDGYRPGRYRLPSADLLPSARSARRVGCVMHGTDPAGTDASGGDRLPSARQRSTRGLRLLRYRLGSCRRAARRETLSVTTQPTRRALRADGRQSVPDGTVPRGSGSRGSVSVSTPSTRRALRADGSRSAPGNRHRPGRYPSGLLPRQ
ncbi:MAG: hypothetical protein ACJAQ3_002511 [Planctomycetota bacterium]|jgi:hypothetical protein